ncbi:hypothetical protein EJB05_03854, partial [Eragrostis curvula]
MAAPAPALAAPPPATVVVVDARFCTPAATAFAVTKTISVTGRDFTVTDAGGAAVMQVEAEVFAFLRRSVLLDVGGGERRAVLTMRDAGLFTGAQWDVFRGDSTSQRNKFIYAVSVVGLPDQDALCFDLKSNGFRSVPR